MRIYINELSEEPTHLHYSETDPWVKETILQTEESHDPNTNNRCIIDFELHKTQDLVFLKSNIDLNLGLLCSRCVKQIQFPLKSQYQCIYTQNSAMDPIEGQVHGVAYSSPTGSKGEDLDIQQLENDYIELKDVLKEQIYLQLPYQPLCKEDCKGICPVCGQDQNTHPCQCHRIKNTVMASALKNLKIKVKGD